MLTGYSVKKAWYKTLEIIPSITLVILTTLSFSASAIEWPPWQGDSDQGTLTFDDGDTVILNGLGEILNYRPGGMWDTTPPTVPGWNGKTPPHAAILTPGHPQNVVPDEIMVDLDLSNKTITPDTTFGFGDMPAFKFELTLLDKNDNELPLDDIAAEHFNIFYDSSGVTADKNVAINPATGILTLGLSEGSSYDESGLTLFTNLPPETTRLTIRTTQSSFGDFFQFYFGEGSLGSGGSGTDPDPDCAPPSRVTINSDLSNTTAVIYGGVTADNGNTFPTNFSVNETIEICADIFPEASEIGSNADIYVVVSDGVNLLQLTPTGLVLFNGTPQSLIPFSQINLQATNPLDILAPFGGQFTLTSAEIGNYILYIGYRIGNGVVTYTGEAVIFKVVP